MHIKAIQCFVGALSCIAIGVSTAAQAQLMIVGNDEKVGIKDGGGLAFTAPGRDTVTIVDIGTNPEEPKIVTNLPLMNSLFGPPTNLAITPDEKLAIVANAVDWVKEGDKWKPAPDNKVHVIDLTMQPPKHISTVEVGQRPSGLAINRAGDLALVANRAGKSVSVLSIDGNDVKLVGTVDMSEEVAAIAFTPDGKRALAAKFSGHKIALLNIDGQKVTYDKYDMPVGLWPYNVQITPDGRLGLTADNGNRGRSDGHIDTVSVIDLEADPPRVIDRIVVGDAPEGLVVSPTGKIAVAVLLNGGGPVPPDKWFYNRDGKLAILEIDGNRVRKIDEVDVGGLPEGAVFSPDGGYLYIGNFVDGDISILKVDGTKVTDTGKRLELPGHPAAMRGSHP